MVLFHIKAEWNSAEMEDGQLFALAVDIGGIIGIIIMQLLCVVNWDIQVQVCMDCTASEVIL